MKFKRLNMIKKHKLNPPNFSTGLFASNGQHEIDEAQLDEILDDPKTPAVVTLDSCDIKPVSFLGYSSENQSFKNPLTVLFLMGSSYSCVKS